MADLRHADPTRSMPLLGPIFIPSAAVQQHPACFGIAPETTRVELALSHSSVPPDGVQPGPD